MPTKMGDVRPRAGLGLTSHVPTTAMAKRGSAKPVRVRNRIEPPKPATQRSKGKRK
jgi:hypothetical protein